MFSHGLDIIDVKWTRIKNFEVINGVICISDKSILEEYNPFYCYNHQIPQDVVNYILNDKLNNHQNFYIHTLFLSLNSKDMKQIDRWINHFGILEHFADENNMFTADPEFLLGELPEELLDEYGSKPQDPSLKPIAHMPKIAEKIKLMQLTAWALEIVANNYTDVESYINKHILDEEAISFLIDNHFLDYLEDEYPILKPSSLTYATQRYKIFNRFSYSKADIILKRLENKQGFRFIRKATKHLGNKFLDELIEFFFSQNLFDISPSIKINSGKLAFKFNTMSLIGLIYFFLAMNISSNIIPRKCNAKKCANYFIATREDTIYCSDTCKNRAKQQRHRAKIKKEQS